MNKTTTEDAARTLDINHGELIEALVRDRVLFVRDGFFQPYKKHIDNGRFLIAGTEPGQLHLNKRGVWLANRIQKRAFTLMTQDGERPHRRQSVGAPNT